MKNVSVQNLKQTVETYVNGYLQAEAPLIEQVFFPHTHLLSTEDGKLDQTSMPEWLENIRDRKNKGDVRTATSEILVLDVTDDAAITKVILTFKTFKFVDYLSLLKIEGSWQIVGKIYVQQSLS